jgi:hypothetical protein
MGCTRGCTPGCTPAARRAGIHAAASATGLSNKTPQANVSGWFAWIPYGIGFTIRLSAGAPPSPAAIPTNASHVLSRRIIPRSCLG